MEKPDNNKIGVESKNKSEKVYNTSLPEGFRFTEFRFGDENNWAYIQYSAEIFKDYQSAIRKIFEEEYRLRGYFKNRCLFLENEEGIRIGTLMIVPSDLEEGIQEIKYLALIPKYQRQGLEELLLAQANKVFSKIKGATRIDIDSYKGKSNLSFEKLGFEKI